MLKKSTIFTLALLITLFSLSTSATTWLVNVSDFSFSPPNLPNVIVGDSIKWRWISGNHTTTSHIIPAGAPVWDSPINGGTQTFIYVVSIAGSYHYKCVPHFPGMEGFFTANIIGITPIQGEVPVKFSLLQNYPNPFNPVTEIKFDIPSPVYVKLSVLNILGQEVEVLTNGELNAGRYIADWNASEYSSGIYFYRLDAGSFTDTKKMILIK